MESSSFFALDPDIQIAAVKDPSELTKDFYSYLENLEENILELQSTIMKVVYWWVSSN
jgi:hypothetical protein